MMKSRILLVAAVALVLLAVAASPAGFPRSVAFGLHPAAFFTPALPSGPLDARPVTCKEGLLREICNARKQIRVQMYEFRDPDFANALGAAAARGVHVEVILDNLMEAVSNSQGPRLLAMAVPVVTDAKEPGICNSKLFLIDDGEVITGSYNLSDSAATRNAENMLVLHDTGIAGTYARNYAFHRSHSRSFNDRTRVSAYAGQWRGTWQNVVNGDHGTTTVTVADDGKITGTVASQVTNTSASITGTVTTAGHVTIQSPARPGMSAEGQAVMSAGGCGQGGVFLAFRADTFAVALTLQ